MLVMGLDTSLQRCSVAILRDGETAADRFVDMERGHAEALAPMTAAALAEAGVKIGDLDRIGVVIGPGGFTGLRVALAFARGLRLGTGVAVVGVTSLAALAGATSGTALAAPIIDARRGHVYAGLYAADGACLLEPFVAEPQRALELLAEKTAGAAVELVGSGAGLAPDPPAGWRLAAAAEQIDAKIVARLAAAAPRPDGPPAPLYLRPPDAKPPKPGPLQGLAER